MATLSLIRAFYPRWVFSMRQLGADTYARLAGLFMLDDRLEGFV